MIKNIYGYIYNGETGVLTSIPKAYISQHITTVNASGFLYFLHDPKPGGKQYKVSNAEATPTMMANNLYSIWFSNPDPIKAKALIHEYIYHDLLQQEKKYEKELEKVRKQKKEFVERIGLHDD